VQRGRRDSAGTQGIHLVLHQGDEGGDDDGGSLEQQRRKLEAERFARPRGHHGDQVPPFEHGAGRLELPGPEPGELEPLVQRPVEPVRVGICWQCRRSHGEEI
jgi:hypothetical protein